MPLMYQLPLLGAIFYTLATLFLKRSMSLGAGSMRIVFIANFVAVPIFVPFLLVEPAVYDWSLWWTPLLCSLGNFVGLMLTFIAVRVGDLSIQTPVMGSKVVIVGSLVVLLGSGPVPMQWWVGAFLSLIAVYILSLPDGGFRQKRSKALWMTLFLSLGSAVSFSLCDAVMEKYGRGFGEAPFLFHMVCYTALLSFFLVPFFEGKLRDIPRASWRWGFVGTLFMAFEAVCLYGAISFYGNATAANILYSSRGIWSIVFVWLLGSFFKNEERKAGRSVMIKRMMGSVLLFGAIILVLTS